MLFVEIESGEGKVLHGRARSHRIATDRPQDEGGSDLGCTSGELLLLAIGSCAMGSLTSYAAEQAMPIRIEAADVFLEPAVAPQRFGRIIVAAQISGSAGAADLARLTVAGGRGRVVSRLRAGTEIDIRISSRIGRGAQRSATDAAAAEQQRQTDRGA